jgi:hypothetical protein
MGLIGTILLRKILNHNLLLEIVSYMYGKGQALIGI